MPKPKARVAAKPQPSASGISHCLLMLRDEARALGLHCTADSLEFACETCRWEQVCAGTDRHRVEREISPVQVATLC